MMRLSFTASKNIRLALLRLKHKIRYPRRSVFSNSLSISSAYSIERYSHLYGTLTPISEHAEINLGIGLHAGETSIWDTTHVFSLGPIFRPRRIWIVWPNPI